MFLTVDKSIEIKKKRKLNSEVGLSVIREQIANGVAIRMAVLSRFLSG